MGRALHHLWRLAAAWLLLTTIAAHALQRPDFDLDYEPAPFSAYDDDVILTSLGPNRSTEELKAVLDPVATPFWASPPPICFSATAAIEIPACDASAAWHSATGSQPLREAKTAIYLARAPPGMTA